MREEPDSASMLATLDSVNEYEGKGRREVFKTRVGICSRFIPSIHRSSRTRDDTAAYGTD